MRYIHAASPLIWIRPSGLQADSHEREKMSRTTCQPPLLFGFFWVSCEEIFTTEFTESDIVPSSEFRVQTRDPKPETRDVNSRRPLRLGGANSDPWFTQKPEEPLFAAARRFLSLAAARLHEKSELPREHVHRQSKRRGRFFARIESRGRRVGK